jgi:hypothetical protein
VCRCEHGREKRRCRECGGSGICKHNHVKFTCKQCNAGGSGGICIHNRCARLPCLWSACPVPVNLTVLSRMPRGAGTNTTAQSVEAIGAASVSTTAGELAVKNVGGGAYASTNDSAASARSAKVRADACLARCLVRVRKGGVACLAAIPCDAPRWGAPQRGPLRLHTVMGDGRCCHRLCHGR